MTKKISSLKGKTEHAVKPKPLTRCNQSGVPYIRTEKVEEEIRSALVLDWQSLIARAQISDKTSPDFLQEESLVYYIREALFQNEKTAVNSLFYVLHERCVKYIHYYFRSFDIDRRQDAFQNIITNVVDKIINLDDDSGDFFQVRFWLGLKRLIITEYGSQTEEVEKSETLIFLDEQKEGEDGIEPRLEISDDSMSSDDLASIKMGLSSIENPYRKVFVLRYYEGWPIKSNDPDEVTISSYFKVTPRTIQNWLDIAEEGLAKWRKENKK